MEKINEMEKLEHSLLFRKNVKAPGVSASSTCSGSNTTNTNCRLNCDRTSRPQSRIFTDFKKMFSGQGSRISLRHRSSSCEKSKKVTTIVPNSNSTSCLPPESETLTLDLLPPSRSCTKLFKRTSPPLLYFTSPLATERYILDEIFKLDVFEDQSSHNIERNPFLLELQKFLRSEKVYLLELFRSHGMYAEPLRKFSSLGSPERNILFREFEHLRDSTYNRCQQLKNSLNEYMRVTSSLHTGLLSVIGCLFNYNFCCELYSYIENFPNIQKLHLKLLRNNEYCDFITIIEQRNPPFISSLRLPLKRSIVYAETLKILLLISNQEPLVVTSQQQHHYHHHFSQLIPSISSIFTSSSASSSSSATAKVQELQDLTKDLQIVLNLLAEMSSEVKISIESLQKLFPHDDLMLCPTNQEAATSSEAKKYKFSKKKKTLQYNNNCSSFCLSSYSPDRCLLLNSFVQISKYSHPLHIFLLTDLLLLAKGSFKDRNLELKDKIEVTQMWICQPVEESKCSSNSFSDRSLTIGWPLTNVCMTFETCHLKLKWREALSRQISYEKSKEAIKTIFIRVEAKLASATMCKMIQVRNDELSSAVVQRLLKELRIENREATDFQLCVTLESEDSTFPLSGHEYPFSIQLHELKQMNKSPQDKMAIVESRPLFLLRDKMRVVSNSDEHLKTAAVKSKRKILKKIFKKAKLNNSSKFFGQNLSAIFQDGYPPSNLTKMLEKLFEIGAYSNGIFRKSANHAKLKEITSILDAGMEVDFNEVPVVMIASLMKKFLRSLPDCLLMSHLYYQWMEVTKETDETVIINICKKQYGRLLPFNQKLLHELMCVLRRIDELSEYSTMTSYNLAVCIGPSLLWSPGSNSSSNSSNGSMGSSKKLSEREDSTAVAAPISDAPTGSRSAEKQLPSMATVKSDAKTNLFLHDAEGVNKVVETLIKLSSKIFGDERYNFLIQTLCANPPPKVKSVPDGIKDMSTDGESAASSSAELFDEDKSHLSSLGTVDDSIDYVSGEEKFSSLEDTSDQKHQLLMNAASLPSDVKESESDIRIQKSKQPASVSCSNVATLTNATRNVTHPAPPPRLRRQKRLIESPRNSLEAVSASNLSNPRADVITASGSLLRIPKITLTSCDDVSGSRSSYDALAAKPEHVLLRKSSSLLDTSTLLPNGAKAGLLHRRGMTERGADVFPDQIINSLFVKKAVNLSSVNSKSVDFEKLRLRVNALVHPKNNEEAIDKSLQSCSTANITTSATVSSVVPSTSSIISPSIDQDNVLENDTFDQSSPTFDQQKPLTILPGCTSQLQKPNKLVFFGRRLPPRFSHQSSEEDSPKIQPTPNQVAKRFPPPSYKEATEYLKKKEVPHSPLQPGEGPFNIKSTESQNKSALVSSNAAPCSVSFSTNTVNRHLQDSNALQENIKNISADSSNVSSNITNLQKYPTIYSLSNLDQSCVNKDKSDQVQSATKMIQTSPDFMLSKEMSTFTNQLSCHNFSRNKKKKKVKRHSDPRLSKVHKKFSKSLGRSRSDVIDCQKWHEEWENIPDILADLKNSGISIRNNVPCKKDEADTEVSSLSKSSDNPKENFFRKTLVEIGTPRTVKNRDWHVRLSKQYQEIEEEDNSVTAPSLSDTSVKTSRNKVHNIIDIYKQKFEGNQPNNSHFLVKAPISKKLDKTLSLDASLQSSPNSVTSPQNVPFQKSSCGSFFPHSTTIKVDVTNKYDDATQVKPVPRANIVSSGLVTKSGLSTNNTSNVFDVKSAFNQSIQNRDPAVSEKILALAKMQASNRASKNLQSIINKNLSSLNKNSVALSEASSSNRGPVVGKPISIIISASNELESSRKTPATTNQFHAEVFKSRDVIDNPLWNVAELRKIYADKEDSSKTSTTTVSSESRSTDVSKRLSLPSPMYSSRFAGTRIHNPSHQKQDVL